MQCIESHAHAAAGLFLARQSTRPANGGSTGSGRLRSDPGHQPTARGRRVRSQRIIYLRDAYKLEYFANSEWVDPPARMLPPLLVSALERSGAFRAVIQTPGSASGDLRLDTQVIRLQHEFQTTPSHARFTLRAYLVDDKSRRVVAWREFEADVPAASDDPYGGVVAANKAVQMVLADLSAFCAEATRGFTAGK